MNIDNHIDLIFSAVKEVTGVDLLNNNTQKQDVIDAKRIFCYLTKTKIKASYEKIGSYINRDHSTVLFHKKRHPHFMETEKSYRNLYKRILKRYEKMYEIIELENQNDLKQLKYKRDYHFKKYIKYNEKIGMLNG